MPIGGVVQHTQEHSNSGVVMTKRTLLASAALAIALSVPAQAAGPWSGIYLGVHAGGIWGDVDTTKVGETGVLVDFDDFLPGSTFDFSPNGVVGGGQLGYNFQMNNWVFGAEVSGSFSDYDQTRLHNWDDVKTVNSDWNAAATLRAGWAFNQSLVYVKGGYAMADLEHGDVDDSGGDTGSYSASENHGGWTAGAGFEHLLSSDVSLAVEYDYYDLSSEDHVASVSTSTITHDIDMTLHTVTARLNWHFNP